MAAILDFTLKLYMFNQYILVYFDQITPRWLRSQIKKRFHNYCNLCRVTPTIVTDYFHLTLSEKKIILKHNILSGFIYDFCKTLLLLKTALWHEYINASWYRVIEWNFFGRW